MDNNLLELSEDDFIVRIRPTVVDKEWTGEVDIAIVTSAHNQLDDESFNQMIHFTKMMCATVPMMEYDEEMRDYVHNYVMEELDNMMEEMVEHDDQEVVITKEDGNIVRLSFGSKTKGNA